jgi:uncharacterized protein YbjT (DUF2867 family)
MALACVTGATGYVANELIAQLLEKGYHVRATCRCEPSSANLAALRGLAEASPGKLDLIQVDSILEPSPALSGAVSGVKYLFHVSGTSICSFWGLSPAPFGALAATAAGAGAATAAGAGAAAAAGAGAAGAS